MLELVGENKSCQKFFTSSMVVTGSMGAGSYVAWVPIHSNGSFGKGFPPPASRGDCLLATQGRAVLLAVPLVNLLGHTCQHVVLFKLFFPFEITISPLKLSGRPKSCDCPSLRLLVENKFLSH